MLQALIRKKKTRKICSKLLSRPFAGTNSPADKEEGGPNALSYPAGAAARARAPGGGAAGASRAPREEEERAGLGAGQAPGGGASRARGRLGSAAMLASSALYCHK